MNGTDLINLGYNQGIEIGIALNAVNKALEDGRRQKDLKLILSALRAKPKDFINHQYFSELAKHLVSESEQEIEYVGEIKEYKIWGKENIDEAAIIQMNEATMLPVAVGGALMPDAHLGYGLPIGGVLACENAIIPYAVGSDIGCSVKLSVIDLPTSYIEGAKDLLKNVLEKETRFGAGASFDKQDRKNHEILDSSIWGNTEHLRNLKDKAWEQLGSSGTSNHFCEYGIFNITEKFNDLEVGEYLAIFSHSGSRGPGANTCKKYNKIAIDNLPKKYKNFSKLAWLDMDSSEGQEYWEAMNLMGKYALANHNVIHKSISKKLGSKILYTVENSHNLCWKEIHNGKELYVHRKGATPASNGQLGMIPGSMADSCFMVKGLGNIDSFNSASHGAGRLMSRTKANNSFTWSYWKNKLKEKKVELISAGLDEMPGAYKPIKEVMESQKDLVVPIAEFMPRIVKMSSDGIAED